MADLERVKVLVRELHREIGLDGSETPPKKKPVETQYEEVGGGTFVVDLDEDGAEVGRQFLAAKKISRGMKPAMGGDH